MAETLIGRSDRCRAGRRRTACVCRVVLTPMLAALFMATTGLTAHAAVQPPTPLPTPYASLVPVTPEAQSQRPEPSGLPTPPPTSPDASSLGQGGIGAGAAATGGAVALLAIVGVATVLRRRPAGR